MHRRIPDLLPPALVCGLMLATALPASAANLPPALPFIVTATSASAAGAEVRRVGGHVSRPLPLINAVAADLNPRQAIRLGHVSTTQVFADRAVSTRATGALAADLAAIGSTLTNAQTTKATGITNSPPTVYLKVVPAPSTPALVQAQILHAANTTGAGVTIAMLDSGFTPPKILTFDRWGSRVLATVDFSAPTGGADVTDLYGHGTQITSVAGSAAQDSSGAYYGVAPGANFVIVRAFDGSGAGSYSSVISGLSWIVANQLKYHIRIVNLSLGATPQSAYWDDPLNQAVMKVWQAGIVVVVAAGNSGPAAQSINVPGNVPYVITVGAMTDNHTPYLSTDDHLASFSSAGPTFEGFVKPEVIAPGGHVVGTMPNPSTLSTAIFGVLPAVDKLFPLSGTSQAAAVTSGVIALLLQQQPGLSPDEVKCKLMAGAAPAVTSAGNLAYSVFQQGAGLISRARSTSAERPTVTPLATSTSWT
jgi:serine protease AprX